MDHLISVATSAEVASLDTRVALLPVGSYEQHGEYLPLSTDTLVASAIAREIAKSYPVALLPPITIACSHEHAGWPGTVSISARTLHLVINDIAASLSHSDVDRLVVINGHGGNYVLSNVVQEASVGGPRMALFPQTADWIKARTDAGMETTVHEDMHAGEAETSILLHVCPDVVRPGNETADWLADDRPHLLSLGMSAYTTSGVIGRPSLGSAAKGAAALASFAASFKDTLDVLLQDAG
ncbi:creatininase family protein [Rugosimonospora africana]|uniref:Creatinine amidohydrolase n=1 Tax=Rugosimonospora africana TaxID=556532 RepID=A0A8J3VQU9_9ACTN|nr:creatininase family protein [Rugosimonospora africana]GIH14713.1 creatinine amidohydrolase [Rugosimonospora africana]